MKNSVSKLALTSVFTAVSVILCFVASLFSTISLAICALTGIVTLLMLMNTGYKYTFLHYIAVSVLVLLLCPNKECAIYYIFLFGIYPIYKLYIERVKNRIVLWTLKILAANLLYALVWILTIRIMGLSENPLVIETVITFILYNITFVVFDICLTRIMFFYILKRFKNNRLR